jgi:DNA-binding CsgD family transcriptional regulator
MLAINKYAELAHRLWDELADRPMEHAEETLRHLLQQTCDVIGAHTALWIGAVRVSGDFADDPLSGWRARAITHLHPTRQLIERIPEEVKRQERGETDLTTLRQIAGAGTFRVHRLVDLVPPEWFESAYYQSFYRSTGRDEAIWAIAPVNSDAECYFGIFRGSQAPRFTAEERDAFGYILRGLKWFHRRLMLGHGLLIAETPLTPTEKKVLHGLLTGRSEKEIAAQIGQSYNTTHEHVGVIYRKFAVNNRAALMSLWIGSAA